MARSKVVTAIVTPVLDLMQTMPSFVYLLPFVILFGIGAACATLVTLVYALPPVTRITAHAIRNVSATTLEATSSLGQTNLQRLRQRRAADGQAHDHRRRQPDDDGGPVDGDHRGVHRQPRPGPAGHRGP